MTETGSPSPAPAPGGKRHVIWNAFLVLAAVYALVMVVYARDFYARLFGTDRDAEAQLKADMSKIEERLRQLPPEPAEPAAAPADLPAPDSPQAAPDAPRAESP